MDGDTLLIGPKVYVRTGNTWTFQTNLAPNDTENYGFGNSVAVQGNIAVVGAPGLDTRCHGDCDPSDPPGVFIPGAVYIFARNGSTWSQVQKLKPADDGLQQSDFGFRVDLDGNTLVASSLFYEAGDFFSGVHLFEYNGSRWNFEASFLDPGTGPSFYGTAVDVQGDRLIVGAPGGFNDDPGAAFLYLRTGGTWTQQDRIDGTVPRGEFGHSLALTGNTALIGGLVPRAGTTTRIGAVHVYTYNGTDWVSQQTLPDSDDTATSGFGGFAVSGDTALIWGASRAYVFTRNGTVWTEQQILTLPNGNPATGSLLGLNGNTAVISSFDNPTFVFTRQPSTEVELLVNGSFEEDANGDFVPDGWTRLNPTSDIRICNPAIAFAGNCLFQFKGNAGENSYLRQDINLALHDLGTGDRIHLKGYRNATAPVNVKVRLIVNYVNASLGQDKEVASFTTTTTGYKFFTRNITLDGTPMRIRVELQNKATDGRIRFDAMSLIVEDSAALVPLPLPSVP
ncbi:MAG: hypothetical protein H7X77_10735 [Anaerolineae bacterium]|nr:hypothetical protein [Anaerolineae bacterium]